MHHESEGLESRYTASCSGHQHPQQQTSLDQQGSRWRQASNPHLAAAVLASAHAGCPSGARSSAGSLVAGGQPGRRSWPIHAGPWQSRSATVPPTIHLWHTHIGTHATQGQHKQTQSEVGANRASHKNHGIKQHRGVPPGSLVSPTAPEVVLLHCQSNPAHPHSP